jgi:hypothetical protein
LPSSGAHPSCGPPPSSPPPLPPPPGGPCRHRRVPPSRLVLVVGWPCFVAAPRGPVVLVVWVLCRRSVVVPLVVVAGWGSSLLGGVVVAGWGRRRWWLLALLPGWCGGGGPGFVPVPAPPSSLFGCPRRPSSPLRLCCCSSPRRLVPSSPGPLVPSSPRGGVALQFPLTVPVAPRPVASLLCRPVVGPTRRLVCSCGALCCRGGPAPVASSCR